MIIGSARFPTPRVGFRAAPVIKPAAATHAHSPGSST
jgi:hypothetical protein